MNKTDKIREYILKNPPSYDEKGYLDKVAKKFNTTKHYVQHVANIHNLPTPRKVGERDKALLERRFRSLEESNRELAKRNRELLKLLDKSESFKEQLDKTRDIESYQIKPKERGGTSEAVAVMVASDWHVEEIVERESVNGLNEYNPDISKKCAELFFQNGLRLIQIFGRDVKIDTCVLALLGDAFSNDIHEELAESNAMLPMDACRYAQNLISSGIEFLLNHSKLQFVIPCHSGNHARTTREQRHATEAGHSLEFYMYHNLANYFRDEKRVKFIIPTSYLSYLDICGMVVRFHHGHAVRYQGGVGGIYIPMNKAIAQWDKSQRADLSVAG